MMKTPSNEIQNLILTTLQREVAPAMGCTEPVAVALAVAKAKELLADRTILESIQVSVSPNIYKNGLAVGIPGTREVGLVIAAARHPGRERPGAPVIPGQEHGLGPYLPGALIGNGPGPGKIQGFIRNADVDGIFEHFPAQRDAFGNRTSRGG